MPGIAAIDVDFVRDVVGDGPGGDGWCEDEENWGEEGGGTHCEGALSDYDI